MLKINRLNQLIIFFCIFVTTAVSALESGEDPHLWLEEIDGDKALAWVAETNKATDETLASDPLYKEIYQDVLNALDSKDKLPNISLMGEWIYNLHKDATNPRGLYRRTTLASFKAVKTGLGKPYSILMKCPKQME